MEARGVFAASLLMLSACEHYEQRPVDLPGAARSLDRRALDAPDIEALKTRLAPGAATDAGSVDRLWMLAAILASDPKVAAAHAAVATSRAQARAQRHVVTPTLTLTGEYANDPTTSSPWLIGGAVDLPLDMGGRRTARLRSADLALEIARYAFAETVWSERMAARRALVARFVAERRSVLDGEMLTLRDRQLAAVNARRQSGEASNADVESAKLAREAAARDLQMAETDKATADATLASILGVPVAALYGKDWDWRDFDAPPALAKNAAEGNARLAAITARADVLRALADYDTADAAYRGEIARQYPAFTLSPGYTWERGLVKLPLSVGLVLPPLDFNRHAIAAAARSREEAGSKLEAAVAAAGGEIDAARIEQARAAAALADIRQRDLPVAEAMAKRADNRLRVGDIDRIEWADAQAALLEARGRDLDALARVQMANAALEDAMRQPLEGPETMVKVSVLEVMR